MQPKRMNPKKQKAGRLGGLATFHKYRRKGRVARGKKGGRPRALTLEDRQQQSRAQEIENKEKGGMDTPDALASASLKELKRLFKLHQRRSTGNTKYKAGEG